MSRIERAFAVGARERRPLVIPFVTAGFPRRDSTVSVVRALVDAGADMIEIGMPFSDPLADGPTIQRASETALANGMSLRAVLDVVRALRAGDRPVEQPLLLMGYCNPIFRYGLEAFTRAATEAGVDGLIVPDLPPEEADDYRAACREAGLAAVFLVAPNAPDDRVRQVDRCSSHFSYCVTVTGVTGARGSVEDRSVEFLERVRRLTERPFVVGFGVREPEHVRTLGRHAAGVVVGSALIDAMEGADDPGRAAAALVGRLREAADGLGRERVRAGGAGPEGG